LPFNRIVPGGGAGGRARATPTEGTIGARRAAAPSRALRRVMRGDVQ